MNIEFIKNLFSDSNFYSFILFGFCCPAISWFLGFSIKSILDLLRNVKSVI